MRDPGLSLVFIAREHIPVVIANQRVLVGILRYEAKYGLKSLRGHKALLGGGVVDPFIDRGKMQLLQQSQRPNDRLCWQADNMLPMPGAIEHGLKILAHGSKLLSPDVKCFVRPGCIKCCTIVDCLAQILHA